MVEHSNYSPSRLKRIIECPASVNFIDALIQTKTIPKETTNSYAKKGSELHKALDQSLGSFGKAVFNQLTVVDASLVGECIDYLDMLVKSKGHNLVVTAGEKMVSLKEWGLPDVYGTLDYHVIDPIKRHIDVIDWKFGSGEIVYAYKNPQLLAYAAGALQWPTQIKSVTLHIVQPAIEHFDTYDLTTDELYEWVHGTLAIAINQAANGNTSYNPGYHQCRWCQGKNYCKARLDMVNEYAAKLFHAEQTLADVPKPEDLTALLELAPLVESTIRSIKLYVTNEILKGNEFPGYKLVAGRSNRSWVNEKNTVKWLGDNTQIEEFFVSKLKSPAQLEKELKTLKKNDDFKKLFENKPGKLALVPEHDKREAIKTEKSAVDVFKEVKND